VSKRGVGRSNQDGSLRSLETKRDTKREKIVDEGVIGENKEGDTNERGEGGGKKPKPKARKGKIRTSTHPKKKKKWQPEGEQLTRARERGTF